MTTTEVDLEALFDQLASFDAKAEIVDGEIVPMSPTGPWPGFAGDMIFLSLRRHSQQIHNVCGCPTPVPSPLEGERARERGRTPDPANRVIQSW